MLFSESRRTGRKNEIWTPAEKDQLINFMVEHPNINYKCTRAVKEGMFGLIIEGKTTNSMIKQVAYMVKQVQLVYKNRHETGQGSLATQTQGKRSTYGYNRLIPLLYETVPLVEDDDLTEHGEPEINRPGTSASHTRRAQLPTTGIEMGYDIIMEDDQTPVGGEPPPVTVEQPPVRLEQPPAARSLVIPAPVVAGASPDPQRSVGMTRTPRRIGQCASVLQELRGLQEQQDGLFLAADTTRRDRNELRRAELSVAAAKTELKKSRCIFQEKKWEKKVEMQEKKWEKKFEMQEKMWQKECEVQERKIKLEELKQSQQFELEKRRLDLEEKKLELEGRQRGIE